MYTIDNFWKSRLSDLSQHTGRLTRGWSYCGNGHKSFIEAPLNLSTEITPSPEVESSPLLLVSAPGAVGKSTLAKQISYECCAIYLDLAVADPVGGNTVSGGILKSGLSELWQNQHVAILIDGLDEARLRVTQEAYEAFLIDIAELAGDRSVPTILFGRTGAVQDAFLVFAVNNVDVPILEIGYYGFELAVEFAMARIRVAKPNRADEITERKAVEGLIRGLNAQTQSDGNHFAGYAPVLQAVADRVSQAPNPQVLVSEIEKGVVPMSLRGITSAILNRERGKLKSLSFSDQSVSEGLYREQEQLHRIAAKLYGTTPPEAPVMTPKDAELYDSALKTWVSEHPFLDGAGKPSSAVFGAVVSAWAMKYGDEQLSEKVLRLELGRGVAANPFFAEFYKTNSGTQANFMPAAHVGVFYNSLRAGLSLGDNARLVIEGEEDAVDEEALRAEIEITLARRGEENPHVWNFNTDQTSIIYLGPYVEDVAVAARYATVDVGPGAEATFVAPVIIQCAKLQIGTERVIAETPVGNYSTDIFFETDEFVGSQITTVPTVRGETNLSVTWPGSRIHPWTAFASEPTPVADPREQEALRRFRKFVISFRSHSKGSLRRYKFKIEHARMTKGSGQAVLDALNKLRVLSLIGTMYSLDPDALIEKVGASYHDCVQRQYSEKTLEFIRMVLS